MTYNLPGHSCFDFHAQENRISNLSFEFKIIKNLINGEHTKMCFFGYYCGKNYVSMK